MMNNKLIAVALVGLMLLVLPAGAATQVSSVTIRGTVAQENGTHPFDIYNMSNDTDGAVSWNPQTFAGFYYDLKHGYGKEKLSISQSLSNDDRTIQENNLVYTTGGNEKQLKVVDKAFNGNNTAAINAGLENFGNNEMGAVEGNYTIVGWQAQKYVAINDKLNKLVKLHYEQGSSDKRTLTIGETWDLGAGWTLSAQSIDAKATPRQVWLVLSKNGVKVEDKVVGQGKIFTYSGDLGGESDVPQFVTYIDSVFAGATTDMVQLKYTWVLDTSVTHIKTGNDYGVLRVKVANSTLIQLNNSETTVSLDKDSTVNIMGNMKFKVADSDSILRFYPMVEYEIPAAGPTTTGTVTATGTATGTATATATGTAVATATGTAVATGTAATTATATGTAAATATPKSPGFEAIFAIAGLLAVSFLVLRQRK